MYETLIHRPMTAVHRFVNNGKGDEDEGYSRIKKKENGNLNCNRRKNKTNKRIKYFISVS